MIYIRRSKLACTLKIIGLLLTIGLLYHLLTRTHSNTQQSTASDKQQSIDTKERGKRTLLQLPDPPNFSQNKRCIYIFATSVDEIYLLNLTHTYFESIYLNEVQYTLLIDSNNDVLHITGVNNREQNIELKLSTLFTNNNNNNYNINNIFKVIPQIMTSLAKTECRWNYWYRSNTILNRRLLVTHVSSYKWYYPVMLVYSTTEESGHDQCDFNNPTVLLIVVSNQMAKYINNIMENSHQLEENIKHMCFQHKLSNQVLLSDGACELSGYCPSSRIYDKYLYHVGSIADLPKLAVFLLREEQKAHSQTIDNMEVEFNQLIPKLNNKYSFIAETFHSQVKPKINWKQLETNCKSASCMQNLIKSVVPLSVLSSHDDNADWRLVNAYTNLNVKRGVDYLLTIADRKLNEHYIMNIENTLKIKQSKIAMTSRVLMKKVVVIAETWNIHGSINKLTDLYLDILAMQNKEIISIRFAVIFTIHIVILSHLEPKLLLNIRETLTKISTQFPENSNITIMHVGDINDVRSHLGQALAYLQLEDVVFLSDSMLNMNYYFIESCYFNVQTNTQILTTLTNEFSNVANNSNIVCLSVNDYIQLLESNLEMRTINLRDIIQHYLKSDLNIIRLPVFGN